MNAENPFNTRAYLDSQLHYYQQQQEEIKLHQEHKAMHADAVMSELHEAHEAMAFNAGLTREQLSRVLKQYGVVAYAMLEYLWRGKAETPEEAHALMMQEAGDEAGKQLVDPYRQAMESKFPYNSSVGHELQRMDRQRKRKRRGWGKKDVQGLFTYMTWKRQWQKELDTQFEAMTKE